MKLTILGYQPITSNITGKSYYKLFCSYSAPGVTGERFPEIKSNNGYTSAILIERTRFDIPGYFSECFNGSIPCQLEFSFDMNGRCERIEKVE